MATHENPCRLIHFLPLWRGLDDGFSSIVAGVLLYSTLTHHTLLRTTISPFGRATPIDHSECNEKCLAAGWCRVGPTTASAHEPLVQSGIVATPPSACGASRAPCQRSMNAHVEQWSKKHQALSVRCGFLSWQQVLSQPLLLLYVLSGLPGLTRFVAVGFQALSTAWCAPAPSVHPMRRERTASPSRNATTSRSWNESSQ